MSTDLLRINSLKKSFYRSSSLQTKVLSDVSFSMKEGEIVGLIGASGAGKSTIGRIISGLETADSGEILFSGDDLTKMKAKVRRQLARDIQMVFQDPYEALSSRMKIHEIVGESLHILQIEKGNLEQRTQLVKEALRSVNLDPDYYMNRYPHELSGGERQRVGLARAFVCKPKLILADEPTSMLDTSLRLDLIRLMKRMNQQEGTSYLFITHDIALTRDFCDRLIVLKNGEIVETGETLDVIMNPVHPYTKTLIEALLILENHGG